MRIKQKRTSFWKENVWKNFWKPFWREYISKIVSSTFSCLILSWKSCSQICQSHITGIARGENLKNCTHQSKRSLAQCCREKKGFSNLSVTCYGNPPRRKSQKLASPIPTFSCSMLSWKKGFSNLSVTCYGNPPRKNISTELFLFMQFHKSVSFQVLDFYLSEKIRKKGSQFWQ